MPQLKSPSSLHDLALSKIRIWLVELANTIISTLGNYDVEECRLHVAIINNHIGRTLPVHLIEELFNSSRPNSPHFENQNGFDPRVLVSLYVQPNMRTLRAHRVVDDGFWMLRLPSMRSLVRLDLNKVCTDEILEVVGRHCELLEYANIMSKTCHARSRCRHNALRLQLCVSDAGLDALATCKRLREIEMTCVIRKGCGGRQVTDEGILRLVLALPKLARINYTDTGQLMDVMPKGARLALVSVTDYHPCATRVAALPTLCPRLTELNLTYAFSSDDDGRSDVIAALASSGLRLSSLSLTNFSFDQHLVRYLELKGAFLKSFKFVSHATWVVDYFLATLAITCPDLEKLQVYINMCPEGPQFSCPRDLNFAGFANLRSLVITGVVWDPNLVLPQLLINAKRINKIAFNNHSHFGSLDEAFEFIQRTNQFLNLETISFHTGANVSFQFLRKFVLACPVLKHVTVDSQSEEFAQMLLQLSDELRSKNMDINISFTLMYQSLRVVDEV